MRQRRTTDDARDGTPVSFAPVPAAVATGRSGGPDDPPSGAVAAVAAVATAATDAADALASLTTAVDVVVSLPLDGDERQLRGLAAAVTSAIGRLEGLRARAVHTAEKTGAVATSGATSAATWLADATGGTPAAAARTTTLGRVLDRLPRLAEAVASGAVGTEHAASIARAASRGVLPDEQLDGLVDEAARTSAGAFARTVRAVEARRDQSRLRRDEASARDRRAARWWRTDDGGVEGTFRLDGVAGAVVTTALDALTRPDPADTPDELRRTPTQRRADALTALARQALDRGDLPVVRTVRPHVTVTVPVTMLAATDDEAEDAGAVGTLPDGTVVSARLARRLLCDATVRRLVVDPHGRPLDVGRATRQWSAAQTSALAATDGGCRGPACDRPFAWTEIHHVRWWRRGGRTGVDNGLPLCGRCHDLVHHDGWAVDLDPATRTATWTAPDGRTTSTLPHGPAVDRRHAERRRR